MKKIKNLLLMAIGICSIFGVSLVQADANNYFKFHNQTLVCNPAALKPGDKTKCYIAGQTDIIDEPSDAVSPTIHGYVTAAFVTKDLIITDAKVNSGVTGAASAFTHAGTGTGTFTGDDMPREISTNVTCVANTDWTTSRSTGSSNDIACAVFYTKSTVATNAFTPTNIKDNAEYATVLRDYRDYGIIGYYEVQLPADANSDGSCGEICVKAWGAKSVGDYATIYTDGRTSAGSVDEPRPNTCVEISRGSSGGGASHVPNTGAFTSYTVLIAGALIAIGAVTIAQKNNKFNKI